MNHLTFTEALKALPTHCWSGETVLLRPIAGEDDLWYATAECRLLPEQENLVNPAGFSIGRAWMNPAGCLPCVICSKDGQRIGFLLFLKWPGGGEEAFSWSYYLDKSAQGQGYGKAAARLAASILKTVSPGTPIKLSTEADNQKAQRLYQSIGFRHNGELDGDDLVFVL